MEHPEKDDLHKQEGYDLLTHRAIIAELKAVSRLLPEHEAQLLNYLKATGLKVDYLINFGRPDKLEWKRMVL